MRVDEIEMVCPQTFSLKHIEEMFLLSSPIGGHIDTFVIHYLERLDDRVIFITDEQSKLAAFAGFTVRLNGKVWQAKNSQSFVPYKGKQLVAKIYKYVKEQLKKSVQSDYEQTSSGHKLWTHSLPQLGLSPMIFDSHTNLILNPTNQLDKLYPTDDSLDLHRYYWILEKFDHYPSQNILKEDTLLLPLSGLWYSTLIFPPITK